MFKRIFNRIVYWFKDMFSKEKRKFSISATAIGFVTFILLIIACAGAKVYPSYTYIKTAEDLELIRENLNGDFKVMNQNISIKEGWVPIGDLEHPFTGTIVGNDAYFSFETPNQNFVENEEQNYFGLFAYNKGSIRDLNFYMHNISIVCDNDNPTYFGIVTAFNDGDLSRINIIKSTGTISVSSNYLYSGSLCGKSRGNIIKCKSNVSLNIKTNNGVCGGLIGTTHTEIEIQESLSATSLNIDGNSVTSGGFVGSSFGELHIINSLSNAQFNIENSNSAIIGGFVGSVSQSNSKFENSYFSGKVSSDANMKFGGFYGSGISKVSNSLSRIVVVGTLFLSIGAFSGENNPGDSFTNSYFTVSRTDYVSQQGEYKVFDDISIQNMNWDSNIWLRKNGDFTLYAFIK